MLTKILLQKGYFPAGMEWFAAIDEEQFEYIKQIIDQSDYYVIILGGLYGTLAPDGISYTEKEYNYAISKNKKIIALIQNNPTEREIDARQLKFTEFRKKVAKGRLVRFWDDYAELASLFSTSLEITIKKYPTQGWIRCNSEKCDIRLEFCDMNSKLPMLNVNRIKTIHIMASGTSSYIQVVNNIIRLNKNKKSTINIYIFFRLGNDLNRINTLKNEYNNWWNNLTKEYPNIKYHFLCIKDFKMSFRGVILNENVGYVGFYIKDNKISGTLENSIFVDKNTDAGKYIIKCFLKCFANYKDYPTLRSCVENSSNSNTI